MKAIGGYFELELNKNPEFHKDLVAVNTGRNALEYILRAGGYKKIFIPYYTCSALLEPLNKLNLTFEFYHIDGKLEISEDLQTDTNSAVVYINYFGIKSGYINSISAKYPNLIVDNSQAFFNRPGSGTETFYSCRKFFGVPDGAYLNSKNMLQIDLKEDHSESRIGHLIKRMEHTAEDGYEDFKKNENSLCNQPLLKMSRLTKALMQNIDYEKCRERRKENFLFLQEKLSDLNELASTHSDHEEGPMIYPLLIRNNALRKELINSKIYVPLYWQEILNEGEEKSWEYYLAENLLPLPVDQRYHTGDLEIIVNLIHGKL